MVGTTISHYQILEKLGEGGMGVVYRARDTHLDAVAITDAERKQWFLQEAKAASALNHPHIVTIYDSDEAGGVEFISMEFVPGKTLDKLIPRKGMAVGQALHYALQIADALAPHHAGIIHRDLKPSNLIVDERDNVEVLDFGLAKLAQPLPPARMRRPER